MLSINWFRLIFIIKLIIITLVTIQGAPIDIVEPPAVTISPSATQIPVITYDSFLTQIPPKLGEDNHVESQPQNDFITNVANLNGDQLMLTTSQQEVTTATGNGFKTKQTQQSTTPLTHMEVADEKAKENALSQNQNQNLQNTTEENSMQNENSAENTATQKNTRTSEKPPPILVVEIFNSQINLDNSQNTPERNFGENQYLSQEPMKYINFNNNEKPEIALETENINSQTTIENTQNTTEENLLETPKLTQEKTDFDSKDFDSKEKRPIALDSENMNSQNKNENFQNTPKENVLHNQSSVKDLLPHINIAVSENPLTALKSEIVNSHNENEKSQNTTEENLLAHQTSARATSSLVNFATYENPLMALESEIVNSQTNNENVQNTTVENSLENSNVTNATSTQVAIDIAKMPVSVIEPKNINTQNGNENSQNTTEVNLLKNQTSARPTSSLVNFATNENPLIALESEIVNSQTTNENVQNTTVEKSQENSNMQLTIDIAKISASGIESEIIKSQNENENTQNTIQENLQNQSLTNATSSQVNLDINTNPLTAIESEIDNSQDTNENAQNTTVENSEVNPNLSNETSTQVTVDIAKVPVNRIDSENINSEFTNENLPKTTEVILPENTNLIEELSKESNASLTESPQNAIESQTLNSEVGKGNLENTTKPNSTENQSFSAEISTASIINTTAKTQIPLESVTLNSQNVNENLQNTQIEVLKENNDLNKANVTQSVLPHDSHQSDNNLNFFTHNINLQKLTDQIEKSVQNIVKESAENLGKSESNESYSQFLNENIQYFEPNEKTENDRLNEENITEQKVKEQQYNLENGLKNDPFENTQNSSINFLIEETEVKSDINQHPKLTGQHNSESTTALSTAGNASNPIDLTTERKQEQILADPVFAESNNRLTTTENVQTSLGIMSEEETSTIAGAVNEINTRATSNSTWDLATTGRNPQNSTEQPIILETSPGTQNPLGNTVTASNTNLQTSQEMLDTDKLNSQISTENPQNTQTSFSAKSNAFDEQVTSESSLHDFENHQPKVEAEIFDSKLTFPNTENAQLNALIESEQPVAQTVEKLTVENSNLQISPEFNENMTTQLLFENAQNPNNDSQLSSVVATHQNLETEKQFEEKSPLIYHLSTVVPNAKQNLSNLLENQSSMTQESSTISSAEETTEKIVNANNQHHIEVNSDASLENPGFLTLTKNIDVAMTDIQTTNFANEEDLKTSTSSNEEVSSKDSGRSEMKTAVNWNTEKSAEGTSTTTDNILFSSTESESTHGVTVDPKTVEETTDFEIPKFPSSTEGNIEFNLQKAFESLLESKEGNESLEATTIFSKLEQDSPSAETTTPITTTEAAAEEPTATTNRDRNSYMRSTTNSQFASLLEETEMSVHKAFKTLREWIENGKKLDEATKNPAQMEEVSTTIISEVETTKLPESTEYTTITESGETAKTKEENESESTLNTLTAQETEEERIPTSTMNIEEVERSTLSPVLETMISPEIENFNYTKEKLAKLQVKEDLLITQDETTMMPDREEESTPISGNENATYVPETSTESGMETSTVEPTITRVKLHKDQTGINLTYQYDSSEEVASENHIKTDDSIENKSEIAHMNESQHKEDASHNRNAMNVKFYNRHNTILYQPTPVTGFYQEMVKFIERQTTETPKQEQQTQVPLTQASFMQEQQQQIESTTESDIRSEHTTLEGPGDMTTLRETNVDQRNATTEVLTTTELQPTNKISANTELHSTATELPTTQNSSATIQLHTTTELLTTTELHTTTELPPTTDLAKTTEFPPTTTEPILETTITTEEDTTTATDEPEIAVTTLIATAEPEGRSLALPPPKLEYLQNEDGVEVFYGYSIVKHN